MGLGVGDGGGEGVGGEEGVDFGLQGVVGLGGGEDGEEGHAEEGGDCVGADEAGGGWVSGVGWFGMDGKWECGLQLDGDFFFELVSGEFLVDE